MQQNFRVWKWSRALHSALFQPPRHMVLVEPLDQVMILNCIWPLSIRPSLQPHMPVTHATAVMFHKVSIVWWQQRQAGKNAVLCKMGYRNKVENRITNYCSPTKLMIWCMILLEVLLMNPFSLSVARSILLFLLVLRLLSLLIKQHNEWFAQMCTSLCAWDFSPYCEGKTFAILHSHDPVRSGIPESRLRGNKNTSNVELNPVFHTTWFCLYYFLPLIRANSLLILLFLCCVSWILSSRQKKLINNFCVWGEMVWAV